MEQVVKLELTPQQFDLVEKAVQDYGEGYEDVGTIYSRKFKPKSLPVHEELTLSELKCDLLKARKEQRFPVEEQ